MQRITRIEVIIWIILTIIIFLIPGYDYILGFLRYLRDKIGYFFGIVKNMTPDDFLKGKESEQPASEIDHHNAMITTDESQVQDNAQKSFNTIEEKFVPLDNKTLDKIQHLKEEALQYKDKQNLEEAEKKLIEATTLNPHDRSLQKLLNDMYFEQGKYIKSATLLKKLLLEEADNHKFLWQLGYIHMQQDDKEMAKILIGKAIEMRDDNPKYYIALVDIHINQENISEAIPLLEKVHKLRPNNIDYLLSLASLYEELHKRDIAHYRYTKIIELDPHHPLAKQKLS